MDRTSDEPGTEIPSQKIGRDGVAETGDDDLTPEVRDDGARDEVADVKRKAADDPPHPAANPTPLDKLSSARSGTGEHGLMPTSDAFEHILSLIERYDPALYRKIINLGKI